MNYRLLCVACFAVSAILASVSFGFTPRSAPGEGVLRQYPVPDAVEVPPETGVGITSSIAYDASALEEADAIRMVGDRSGAHAIRVHLSLDGTTLVLRTVQPFDYDESVTVTLAARLVNGTVLTDSFRFRTMGHSVSRVPIQTELGEFIASSPKLQEVPANDAAVFPQVLVDQDATPGTIYLSPFDLEPGAISGYLECLNQHGQVIRSKDLSFAGGWDFKIQPNGLRTYFDNAAQKYYALDTSWNVIDSFAAVNGYATSAHEFRMFANGSYALLAISQTPLPPKQFVPGMDSSATVQGSVIQMFDSSGTETFEWRGIDHYRVADAIHEDLTKLTIDFEHANAIEFDSAGNLLLSNRHLCEITKIDGRTGAMLWRLGGAHDEFKLVGDSVWFSYQHAVRLLPNGHLTLFDNSNYDSVNGVTGYFHHSRALEYALDTAAKTATLVWQWHHTPETYSAAMGYVERLPNGNTFIGWGANPNFAATEVRPDNSTAFEMALGNMIFSYRVVKYPAPDTQQGSGSEAVSRVPVANALLDLDADASMHGWNARFSMPRAQAVSLDIFDPLGVRRSSVLSGIEASGEHSIGLPVQGLVSGTYYCVLRRADGAMEAKPFRIVR